MIRRAALGLAYVLASIVVLAAMLVLHVSSRPGRAAVRDVANAVLQDLFKGRLHIGEVEQLDLRGRLVASDVRLTDPRGRKVIVGGRLEAWPVSALWRGLRHRGEMPSVRVHADILRFYAGEDGGPSIADAFSPRAAQRHATPAAPTSPGQPLLFRGLDVSVDRVENYVGGFYAVGANVRATGGVVTEPIGIDARLAPTVLRTERTPPITARGAFMWRSRPGQRTPGGPIEDLGRMRAEVFVTGDAVACHVVYDKDGVDTRITVDGCRASRAVISQAAGRPVPADVTIASLDARQRGAGGWHVTLAAGVNDSPLELDATIDGQDVTADLTLHGLNLHSILDTLPETNLEGTAHAERRGDRVVLNTERLRARVSGIDIPGARVSGTVVGQRITIAELVAPGAGLRAHGEVDLSGAQPSARGVVDLDTADLGSLPGVRNQVRGAAVVHAEGEYVGGRARAQFTASVRGLRAQGNRVREGQASGTFVFEDGRPRIDVNLRASGVVAGNVGPIDVRGRVSGDPTLALDGRVTVDGTSAMPAAQGELATVPSRNAGAPGSIDSIRHPQSGSGLTVAPRTPNVTGRAVAARGRTRVDATFHARISPDAVRVTIDRSALEVRGATGHVTARVTIPRGRGQVSGSAHIETTEGGEADVTLAGTRVSGRFRAFPLQWAARVAGLPFALSGTIEGDLGLLTNAAGRTHGNLTWTDGRLPYLGEFDLRLTADHRSNVSDLRAELSFGSTRRDPDPAQRHTIRAHVRARPPADMANIQGWVRGIEGAEIDAANVSLDMLQPLLPQVVRVAGRADARLAITRASPGAAPHAVFGIDVRNIRLDGRLPERGARIVRRFIPTLRGDRTAALIAPMRVRAAACMDIERADFSLVPAAIDAVVAREIESPVVPIAPPTECTEAATTAPSRLVRTWGTVAGPWQRAATATLEEFTGRRARRLRDVRMSRETRALLAASPVDLSVTVGPIDSRQWPFSAALGQFVPALGPPRFPGVAQGTAHIAGPMLRPTVRARGALHTTGVEAFVSRDEIDIDASVVIEPREGESLFGDVDIRAEARAQLTARLPQRAVPGGSATGEILANGPLAAMIDPQEGARALDVTRLVFQTSEFRLGRLRWARQHNLDGRLTLSVTGTPDPNVLVSANATISDLQVRRQRAMSGAFNAFLRNVNDQWEVDACVVAGASRAPPRCNPDERGTAEAIAPESGVRLDFTLPLSGDPLTLQGTTETAAPHPPRAAHARTAPDAPDAPVPSAAPGAPAATATSAAPDAPAAGAHRANAPPATRRATVTIPLLGVLGFRPRLNELDTALTARRFRIETISPFIEISPIVRVGGALTASVDWSARAPRSFSGTVLLEDGLVDMERIGEPARDVTLELTGNGRQVSIDRLALRLSLGTLRGRGTADFSPGIDGRVCRVALTASTRELPAVQEGNIYGYLSSEITYEGTFFESGHRGRARIARANVRVPEQPSRTLQNIDPNPNVFIIGETRIASGAAGPSQVYTFDVAFESVDPVQVRRNDFDIAVRISNGLVHYDAAGVGVSGEIEQARQQAWFELFGKRFYFDRLNIYMDGAVEFNPVLDIALHYDSPSAGRITLFLSDRLEAPRLTLASERYPGASQSELLALLILGRADSRGQGDQQTLAQQMSQAAVSLVTGLFLNAASSGLNSAVRGNVDIVPTLVAEPGAAGPQSGRYGLGATIGGRLYVQGTYGAVSSFTGAGQTVADPAASRTQEFRAYGEYSVTDHISISGYGGTSARFGADLFYTP